MDAKCRYRYDVFLSFRGEDTRYTFTGSLYDALRRKGLNPFMDDEGLKTGDQISLSLVKAIEESRISIIVFSENYASSSWCLDELVNILETTKMKNQLVWPIFFKVAPSDVRHQRNSYGETMAAHEKRFRNDIGKVIKWRSALSEVANLKGWHFETGYEYEFIQAIVEKAAAILHREQLYVDEHLIGNHSRIEEVKSLLDIESSDTVCMVGIHGTGGMGKTTLSKVLYNLICDQFECAVFLDSVRERSNACMGLVQLQEELLCKLFERENIKLGSVDEGAIKLKDRLCHMRILLVLDDVDDEEQLKKLAGEPNWFGSGSRIVITTRNKHLLIVHQVEKRYEMKELNDHEALQLFCRNAFKMSQPAANFEEVSNRAVRYAHGLPLALKVMGSNLFGKSILECESALEQYERILDRKIHHILKLSYDCLEDNAKNVFLDIACFFKWKSFEFVKKVLDKCHFFPAYNIGLLVDRSLLTIEYGQLRMHDLIQDMGKEVVRLEEPKKPGQRSRLCFHEDVLSVVTENSGSNNIEGIILDPPEPEEVEWSGTAFEKMNNLRILIVRKTHFSSRPIYLPNSLRLLEWEGYPSESLPNIPRNVVVLSLPYSHLMLEKERPLPKLRYLTYMNFSMCQFITHMPDVSGVPNLRELRLDSCQNLIAVHHSVGFFKELVVLSASCCTKLRTFLSRIWLPSLECLNLNSTGIEHLPNIEGVMNKPLTISLAHSCIKELPHSLANLTGLKSLDVDGCTSLRHLPSKRFRNDHVVAGTGWPNLTRLYFPRSRLTDEDLHFILKCFPNLEELHVSQNNFVSLPARIKESVKLRDLDVSNCMELQEIPELPLSIQKVAATLCPFLTPETSRRLWSQASKEVYGLEVNMPRTKIPVWFDHRCKGDTVSFWARGKFPVIAFAFIFNKNRQFAFPLFDCAQIILCVNGVYVHGSLNGPYLSIVGDQVLLYDPRSRFKVEEWHNLGRLLVHEWNYVEVKCVCTFNLSLTVSYWGAHVYKQQTNMEDVRFMCPDPLKPTTSLSQFQLKKRIKVGGKLKRRCMRVRGKDKRRQEGVGMGLTDFA